MVEVEAHTGSSKTLMEIKDALSENGIKGTISCFWFEHRNKKVVFNFTLEKMDGGRNNCVASTPTVTRAMINQKNVHVELENHSPSNRGKARASPAAQAPPSRPPTTPHIHVHFNNGGATPGEDGWVDVARSRSNRLRPWPRHAAAAPPPRDIVHPPVPKSLNRSLLSPAFQALYDETVEHAPKTSIGDRSPEDILAGIIVLRKGEKRAIEADVGKWHDNELELNGWTQLAPTLKPPPQQQQQRQQTGPQGRAHAGVPPPS